MNELQLNFLFRGGDLDHCFDSPNAPHWWYGRREEEVLIQRVREGLKPSASIVLDKFDEFEERRVIDACVGLHCNTVKNEWGVTCIWITQCPDATLGTLLADRRDGDGLTLSEYLSQRTVRSYLLHGFDMSSRVKECRVGALESAILFGYPFDLARAVQDENQAARVAQAGRKAPGSIPRRPRGGAERLRGSAYPY